MTSVDAAGRHAFVHEAVIELAHSTDPRAVGAAVTVALCGHWDHEGPCRWPHNNELADEVFRTLFVCGEDEESEVRSRIVSALRGSSEWQVISDRERPVAEEEHPLAQSLLRVPHKTRE